MFLPNTQFYLSILGVISFSSLILAGCPEGAVYDQNFNRFYKYVVNPLAFYLAEEQCQNVGGDLVFISNGFENAMVSEAAAKSFGSTEHFWIGANELSQSNWTWMNGSSLTYNNWAPGQGNVEGRCAFSSTINGLWTVVLCSNVAPFVCAYPFQYTCPSPPPTRSYCDSTWTFYAETDSCYKVGHHLNFDDAESVCQASGAHLTSIHSSEENTFVGDLASTGVVVPNHLNMTYIGLKKVDTKWTWIDGSEVNFISWVPGDPDWPAEENCATTYSDYAVNENESTLHKWNDVRCEDTFRAYVCKKPAEH